MSNVMNAKNWDEITDIANLKTINTPPRGPRHRPVNHGEVLEVFKERMDNGNVRFTNEVGLVSPDKYKFVYLVDVKTGDPDTKRDYTFSLGFINYNNKQKSLTVIAGEKVFVCSNEMFSNQMEDTRRRHTENIFRDISDKFDTGVNYFSDFVETRQQGITTCKNTEFDEKDLGKTILNYHRRSAIGNTCINRIIKEWDEPSYDYGTGGGTVWDFQNSVTHVLKDVTDPLSRMNLQRDTQVYLDEVLKKVA